MKKIILLFSLCLFSFSALGMSMFGVKANDEIAISTCKAAYLCDSQSGTVIYSSNETKRLPIASMCKIMTLLLCFEAQENGLISWEQTTKISKNAAEMGGSQVFLEENGEYSVNELIKSICVASANDSCLAMAELLAGSESAFVNRMNQKAKSLGMTNTVFSNCTGLPKPGQYSCAQDVALMFRELLKKRPYYDFCKIRLQNMQHNGGRVTMMTNTNKLIQNYNGCDSGKTGYTAEAGFCLAASAIRNDMRIVSVVIGSDSSAHRFENTTKMFDYAFANYENQCVVKKELIKDQVCVVYGGKTKEITVIPEHCLKVFGRKGESSGITVETQIDAMKAPVHKGDAVGKIRIYKDGIEINSVRLLANEDSPKMNYFERLRDILKKFGI